MDWILQVWTWLLDESNRAALAFVGGAFAVVVGAAWTVYKHFSKRPSSSSPAPTLKASDGGTSAPRAEVGSINIFAAPSAPDPTLIGITLEQYEARLQRREQELREEFAKNRADDIERLQRLERALAATIDKRTHLESAYQEASYSCFISYSHADNEFARRLHDALQERGIRCWLDEKQLKPGDDIFDEVNRGLRLSDKVLLCCSESSLRNSWWVDNEIGTTLDKEQKLQNERGERPLILIPLNLDGFLFSDQWTSGYAAQIRRRLAADFTAWESEKGEFEREVEKVVLALQAA